METFLGIFSPQKAGVPKEEADSCIKELLTVCGDEGYSQEDAIAIIGQACRIVAEAQGTHRKIATGAFCPPGSVKTLEKTIDKLLERSQYDLDKISRAGDLWIVDATTDEYKDTWSKLKR